MSLAEKQQSLVEGLALVDDPQERLAAVVDRARRIPPLPAAERTDDRRVRGCISAVWLVAELREGLCHFRADADSPLVRGLVQLLCDFYDGAPPDEIAASDTDPLAALDLARNLSPTRRNGLAAVRTAIRLFAEEHR